MGRKLLPHTLAIQKGLALVGREVTKVAEGHHYGLATPRRQVAPLGENVARHFPLVWRKALQDFLAFTDALLLHGSHGVPLSQVLADQLLAIRRQALELRIVRHNASLLLGRQFAQASENRSRHGTLLLSISARPAIRFLAARKGGRLRTTCRGSRMRTTCRI